MEVRRISSRARAWWALLVALGLLVAPAPPTTAQVVDLVFTDVTTRAFSVVWAYDEMVSDASVRVFRDEDGTDELTGSEFDQGFVSGQTARELGIVKVEVSGLSGGPCFYVQTQTQAANSSASFPEEPSYLEVCLACAVTKAAPGGLPIANDLIRHPLRALNEATPAAGGLMVVGAPEIGAYPVSAFIESGYPTPAAVVNLNNIIDSTTCESAEIPPGAILEITEYRGRRCFDITQQGLVRFRQAPEREEMPDIGTLITEIEPPKECFPQDTDCNDAVEDADAERVFGVFNAFAGECRFNRDLDLVSDEGLVSDETIDILDAQSVLNWVGEEIQ